MFRRILRIILRTYYKYTIFSQVDCNLDKIVIGPDNTSRFRIANPRKLVIGDHSSINGDCNINCIGGVAIGKHCHIASGLVVYSSNHDYKSEISIPYGDKDILRPVIIGDGVWIGANVLIAPGVQIGDGAVVGMGAVIRGRIPPYSIVVGNPAIVVGQRDAQVFELLRSRDAWI